MTNELVTASLKHGFPDKAEGHISVVLRRQSEQLEFIYHDDGVGIPESVTSGKTEGLGFMLIRSMVDQFEGSLEISGENGTVVRVLFYH